MIPSKYCCTVLSSVIIEDPVWKLLSCNMNEVIWQSIWRRCSYPAGDHCCEDLSWSKHGSLFKHSLNPQFLVFGCFFYKTQWCLMERSRYDTNLSTRTEVKRNRTQQSMAAIRSLWRAAQSGWLDRLPLSCMAQQPDECNSHSERPPHIKVKLIPAQSHSMFTTQIMSLMGCELYVLALPQNSIQY